MSSLSSLTPRYIPHGYRECCGVLSIMCPVCRQHRVPIATCTGSHGGNESAGIKRWLLTGNLSDWESVSLAPSVDLKTSCPWHGHIQNGKVTS